MCKGPKREKKNQVLIHHDGGLALIKSWPSWCRNDIVPRQERMCSSQNFDTWVKTMKWNPYLIYLSELLLHTDQLQDIIIFLNLTKILPFFQVWIFILATKNQNNIMALIINSIYDLWIFCQFEMQYASHFKFLIQYCLPDR